jgi:hypothetical protein
MSRTHTSCAGAVLVLVAFIDIAFLAESKRKKT